MNVDFVIKQFSEFLSLNWNLFDRIMETLQKEKKENIEFDLQEDWLQVNWELLVNTRHTRVYTQK